MKSAIISAIALALCTLSPSAATKFTPGASWSDTSGSHINAHGGCVVYSAGTYYWFGEDRSGSTSNGISCYTSTDLYNWKRVGLAFKTEQALDPETGKATLERPKVIYCDKTEKWVMYIHWENGLGYGEARVCVATADKIEGPYKYESTFRPNGHDSRDQTVFKDKDGRAYHFCATDMNTNINVCLLADDYLSPESNPETNNTILNGLRLEAPAIIQVDDTYFGIFSECSGWNPNPGHYATAYDVMDYWTHGQNFAIDNDASTTYRSQSTYILPIHGIEGAYIYMGDRWNSSNVGGSEYVWLPLSVRSGAPTVKWFDSWDLSVFDNCGRFERVQDLADGMEIRLLDKYSDRWISSKGNGFYIDNDNDATNMEFKLVATDNPYAFELLDLAAEKALTSTYGALTFQPRTGAINQQWRFEISEDGCYRIQNVNDKKMLTVSGASTLASTPIFLAADGASDAQYFGVYFDVRKHDYEKAAMFSAGYHEENVAKMEEQEKYEAAASVTDALVAQPLRIDGNVAFAEGEIEVCNLAGQAVMRTAGRADLSTLAPGVYIVRAAGVAVKVIL